MSMSSNGLASSGRATGTLGHFLSALAQDLATRVLRLWNAHWDYQARRATARMLEALDDRVLKDIGLRRSEIRSAVFGRDDHGPRAYDPSWQKPPVAHRGGARP